jgi:hypothetical protein
MALCGVDNLCWETTYKKIEITYFAAENNTKQQIVLTNTWKIMPAVRSYDVMGIRYHNYTPTTGTEWGQLIYSQI